MTSYTVVVQEHGAQLDDLTKNHYNLQVAKAVSSGGRDARYTMVYASSSLAPSMSVSWTVNYGLNWATEIPAIGSTVNYGGEWQLCDMGASYDLNDMGAWVVNNNNADKKDKALNVGRNGYKTKVHIMVGVKDSSGKWLPIFYDTDALLPNMHGFYQPIEKIKLWWQESLLTSTVIASQASEAKEFDLTGQFTTYFKYDGDTWQTPQPGPFAS